MFYVGSFHTSFDQELKIFLC